MTIKVDPPGPSELFRLESEMDWRERMRRDARQTSPFSRLEFPEGPRARATQTGIIRTWPLQTEFVEPNYLCHRRLFFEEINTERYGWSLGVLQPFASVGVYHGNLAALPFRLLAAPYPSYECSAGYCLPGDPVPYLLLPPLR